MVAVLATLAVPITEIDSRWEPVVLTAVAAYLAAIFAGLRPRWALVALSAAGLSVLLVALPATPVPGPLAAVLAAGAGAVTGLGVRCARRGARLRS